MIISLLQKNNQQLEEMKNRIQFLEGNGSVGVDRNNSQLVISTPLIEKYFPSQPQSNSGSEQRVDFSNQRVQPNMLNNIVNSTPTQNNFDPTTSYYAQNPYYVQQTPQNWLVSTPQGIMTGQNNQNYSQQQRVIMQQGNLHGMGLPQQQQPQGNLDINRHFFDYAMLDYFSGRR